MENLIEIIKEKTQDLKISFIEMKKEHSAKQFDKLEKLTEQEVLDEKGYVSHYNKKTGIKSHTKASYAYWGKVCNIKYNGKQKFIDKNVKLAEMHYENSVEKLAFRIIKKGLVIEGLEVVYGRIGQNIDITFSDGKTMVTAFTILAWGEVNAPHYRFLVK